MRTRCPACDTVFRVTSEQLRLKAGKVRCGHCQAVFNAFDQLLADSPVPEVASPPLAIEQAAAPQEDFPEPAAWVAVESGWIAAGEVASVLPPAEELVASAEREDAATEDEAVPTAELPLEPMPALPQEPAPDEPEPPEPPVEAPSILLETAEESTLAAREAGLVAVRELSDAPAYNRWAAGTLAGNAPGDFDSDTPHRALWPFVIVSLLLLVVFVGQLLYYFRTELVQRWPSSAALFELAAVDVPLPRNVDLVAIETSDLQSDNARGLFVLQATLRNRADYAQNWPALELTLTDTNDTVVSRRVLMAPEYLPPATDPAAFPANGEIAVKLWIEAKNIGAAGYRLYVFYP